MNDHKNIVCAEHIIQLYKIYESLQEKLSNLRGRSCDGAAEDLEPEVLGAYNMFKMALDKYVFINPIT